jgi:hypothetical protein
MVGDGGAAFIMREAADGENDWWPSVTARKGKRGESQ